MRLGAYLQSRKITQAQLARAADTSQTAISLFLNGHRGFSKKVALRIYSATSGEVSLETLLAEAPPRRRRAA